jgi:hypothetical protein
LAAVGEATLSHTYTPTPTHRPKHPPPPPPTRTQTHTHTLAAVGEAVLPALQGSALNAALGLHTSGEGPREHIVRLAVMGVATALFTAGEKKL